MSLITPAVPGDLPQVLTLLQWCGLPQEGLDTLLPTIIVAREAERVVGCAALEVYETVALLRSVAVDPDRRLQALGKQLVQHALSDARSYGVRSVYLLTETAGAYFPRFGFRTIAREVVSSAIHQSVEWTSAQAMVVQLEAPEKNLVKRGASFWRHVRLSSQNLLRREKKDGYHH